MSNPQSTEWRVTEQDVAASIRGEYYFSALEGVHGSPDVRESIHVEPLGMLIFCVLVLDNGFTVVGQAAKVDPVGFDRKIGERIARENAVEKVWQLLGFRLADLMAARRSLSTGGAS